VVRFVRGLGVLVDEALVLRSTNNVVVWLSPSDVVVKISGAGERLRSELAAALVLSALDAPIAPPHPRFGDRVHEVDGFEVSFWVHVPQDDAPAMSNDHLATGLAVLHQRLARLADQPEVAMPPIGAEITTTLMRRNCSPATA